ncbi:PREDICTED: phosphatidylinositol 4-phosphate 5-kinase 5-like [Tarenaya hassleriana]|uniref:phosphatidylinositol 4-phosphate 5-kinase 5-like n=1 Tax=Tarenaya hassleriana TaxID=28532 RepID=UPI00053C9630|nr:PREDICTED: phosphatidylinositol 4-phosphate 5-kinase 5-like [Tarenaya hassleriana]
MDGQKSQAKLTRTQSSLLRSSSTVRSSIHSLASISEADVTKSHHRPDLDDDEESSRGGSEEKPRRKPPRKTGSSPRTGLIRFSPVSAVAYLTFCTLLSFLFFFFYLDREEIPISENLLLALIFVAVTLFFASKNKSLINHFVATVRQLWHENAERLGFSHHGQSSKSVQWFIGEPSPETHKSKREKKVVREAVECYSNGDFYEGEFHKGKCNGSGVYYYFVNGKYEGDWVDGRYDGYGIESWAKGSKYKGQYRQGSRHGYGVYRFYTGDSYAGEWCNGQSHGVGVQTCADGSCFVGEFKYGVKHGLGRYRFRNGDRYAGEYFGDKIHGFGVYHFANGHCYEGSWHEGRKQGYGMYTFRNGVTKCGEWDAGNLKIPLPPLAGPVLRAVQAARKTGDKAMNLWRVDEQVNKAVMSANRAATAARVAAIKAVQNQIDGKFYELV